MLFTKYIAFFALFILAVATPMPAPMPMALPEAASPTTQFVTKTVTTTVTVTETISISQCNTGSLLCCNDVQEASSSDATSILGLLGVILHDLNVLVGLNCGALSVIGAGGSGWHAYASSFGLSRDKPDLVHQLRYSCMLREQHFQ
ncbi:fungal hydrophobin [Sanghuangporus baumii]|uniref:Hydrophobin n=1 Tax=Sanghuangporus baumii TaxID=108892 RepID=A0A9Q5HWD8_SANBA|nr:fungal hydrophobin [Sanghuangporus baumii]